MRIQLSDSFSYGRLIRFTFPIILMMIFTGIYGMVDGLFISNYAGKSAFAAVNLIMPFLVLTGSVGYMLGTGGTALVAKVMGAGEGERAKRLFTMLICFSAMAGVAMGLLTFALLRPMAVLFGAQGAMIDMCVRYGTIISIGQPFFILQFVFQPFFTTAEKPKLGMWITIAAGVINIIGDWLLVGVFGYGIEGAAVASVLSQVFGAVVPVFYFRRNNDSRLRFAKPEWNLRAIGKTLTNGSSEMVTNASMSIVNMLYNAKLMALTGEDGVAAYGVIMYSSFIFLAVFYGYSSGIMPVVGYHYGADNRHELNNLLHKSIGILTLFGVVFTLLAELFAVPISSVFVGFDDELLSMTARAYRIYALSFLVCQFNILGSSYFTALNNGAVSAAISFSRTFLFQVVAILFLPELIGIDGIWAAVIVAELCSLAVTVFFFVHERSRYGY